MHANRAASVSARAAKAAVVLSYLIAATITAMNQKYMRSRVDQSSFYWLKTLRQSQWWYRTFKTTPHNMEIDD